MSLAMRNEVPVELTWDLSLIYPTEEAMYRDVEKMKALCASMEERFKGKLTTPEAICDCLNDLQEMTRLMTLTGNYTDLAVSVDYYDSHNQERNDRVMNIISDINSRLSFINSEITEQSEETLKASIAIAGGSRIYLEDILRRKPHQLHPETERALSALSQTLNTPYQIYNMTKLADMKFDSFHANNKDYPLGYSLFEDDYEYESDTQIRRSAFDAFSKKLAQYENTTAAAYNSQVQTEKTMATLRGFESVFDSLLFDQKVSRELYDRQIDLITTKLSVHMRKYARLLKKIHKLDRMTFADLKISVDPEYDPKVTIEGSKEYIEKGALWNGGVFAFRLGYVLERAHELIDFLDYDDLFCKYETLKKISFDYAVVEHEPEIEVMRFAGTWKDLGTWNTLTEAMDSRAVGEALFNENCENVHVVNELDIPILCMGLNDVVISASPEGILVSDKEQSSYIKPFVSTLNHRVMFAEKSWGSFKIIDIDSESITIKVTLNPGHKMNYHSHKNRDEVWVVISGKGKTVVDGMEQSVRVGDVLTMAAGCHHTVIAETELKLIEVQLGEDINVHDKQKFELEY